MKTKLLLVVVSILASCQGKNSKQTAWDKENMRTLNTGDIRVENANRAAQDSLSFFIDYFTKYYNKSNYHFYLKSKFIDGDNIENMWSKPFKIKEKSFFSVLDNVPDKLGNVNYRDTIEIQFQDVEDFIIDLPDSTEIGNYLQTQFDTASS